MKKLACLFILALALSAFGQATTSVMFPVNSMFGGAIAGKPITITAQNALASDGVNIWAGTYTIIPPSATNPVIGLYPGQYLMTIAGVVKPSRFTVPTTTNVLDVTRLITSGPLIYFNPTNGLFNLWPGSGVTFVTNSDGSITVSSTGGATNASFANLLAGSNITLVTNSGGIVINSTVGAITASQVTGLANGATNATGTNLMDAAKGIAGFQWLQHLTSGSTNPGSVQIAADSAWGGGPWIDMDNTLDQITIHAAVVNFSDVATATVNGQFYGHLFGDADTADLASLATGLAPGSASNLLAAAVQPGTAPSLGLANVTGTLPAATLPGNVVTNIFALVTNNNASAVTISNTLSANIIVGNTLELNLPFVGPSILANRFGIVNPSTGNQLADAGGVYGPLGQKIIDNNGRAGAYDAGLLTNLSAANLVGTIPAATLPGTLAGTFSGNGSGLTNLPAQTNTILAGLAGLPNTNAIVYTNSAGTAPSLAAAKYEAQQGIMDAQVQRDVEDAFRNLFNTNCAFIDGLPLYSRVNPGTGLSMMGRPYSITNGNFGVEGLAGLCTNGIVYQLPKGITNYTVVWVAYDDAISIDNYTYTQPAAACMLAWSLTDSNYPAAMSGSYVGIEGRNNNVYFYRENSNTTWSITAPAGGGTVDTFDRADSAGSGYAQVDACQHGTVYALTGDGQGNHWLYVDSAQECFGYGNTVNYASPVICTNALQTLNIGINARWNTNQFDGVYFNTNMGYAGAEGVYLIFGTTNYAAVVAGYKAAALLDGRPRTFIYGTSILDPIWYSFGSYSPYAFANYDACVGYGTRFDKIWQYQQPGMIFQNWAVSGGSLSNQLYGAIPPNGWSQCTVTNLPVPRIAVTVYEASWFNNAVNSGYSGTYTASNIWAYYAPMAPFAKIYALWQTAVWTNEQNGFSFSGYQINTNLATTWDAINTNPLCNFLSGKINTAQFKAQAVMNTNTGPLLYSLDGVHLYGAGKTNIWNAEINYLNQGIWTMTGYGYLPASTMYDGVLGGSFLGNYSGNGSGLTNLPAQTNTILAGLAGLPNTNEIVFTNSAGVTLAGTFSGNGSGLTNYGQFCEFDGTNTATTFETNWTSTPTVRGSVILGNAALGTMSNTIAPVTVEIELGGTPTASPNGSIPLHQLYTNGVAVPYAYIWSAGAGWRCTWGKVKVTLPAPNVMMQWSNSSGGNMVNAWWKTTVQ